MNDDILEKVNEILSDLDTATANLLTKHLNSRYGIDVTPKELAFVLKRSGIQKMRAEGGTKTPYVYMREGYDRTRYKANF